MGDQLQFIQLEVMVVALGLLVLLADLFLSESARRSLGWVAAGSFHLEHLSAEISQELGAIWSGYVVGEVQNLHPF